MPKVRAGNSSIPASDPWQTHEDSIWMRNEPRITQKFHPKVVSGSGRERISFLARPFGYAARDTSQSQGAVYIIYVYIEARASSVHAKRGSFVHAGGVSFIHVDFCFHLQRYGYIYIYRSIISLMYREEI